MAEETKTEETCSFLEKTMKIDVNREKGKARFTMTSKDYADVLATKGATPDVLKVVKQAQTEVAIDAAKFAEKKFEEINKGLKEGSKGFVNRVEVNLGVGNDSMRVGLTGRRVNEGTVDGKPFKKVKIGSVDIKFNWDFGRKERAKGADLDQIAASCCKFLGAKPE